jgi:hypothetical protein
MTTEMPDVVAEVQRRLDTYHSPSFDRGIVEKLLALTRRAAASKPAGWLETMSAGDAGHPGAASAEPAVAVKALEWDGDISRSVAGCYRLADISQTGNDDEYWQATRDHNIIGEFGYPTIDDAKAAAQADYGKRIQAPRSPLLHPLRW